MLNKVTLIGNLGKDPELKNSQNGLAIANFSLATTERRKDNAGNYADHTEWHNIVCFGKTAENCAQYLAKGKRAYIEGSIHTRKWQDKEGNDRYSTQITANQVLFLSGKDEGGAPKQAAPARDSGGISHQPPIGRQSFDDDDIPF